MTKYLAFEPVLLTFTVLFANMTNDVSFLLVQRKEYFTGNANRQGFYEPVKEAKCPDRSWVYFAGYGRKGDENLIHTLFPHK